MINRIQMLLFLAVILSSLLATISGCELPFFILPPSGVVGAIIGRVTDVATGVPIAGATITTEPETMYVKTDTEGDYAIEYIEPGNYMVTASKDGYNSVSNNVIVEAGKDTIANFELTPMLTPTPTPSPSPSPTPTPKPSPFIINLEAIPATVQVDGIALSSTNSVSSVTVSAIDPYGGPLTITWKANYGVIAGGGSSVIYKAPKRLPSDGQDVVTVTVSDSISSVSSSVSLSIVSPKIYDSYFFHIDNQTGSFVRRDLTTGDVISAIVPSPLTALGSVDLTYSGIEILAAGSKQPDLVSIINPDTGKTISSFKSPSPRNDAIAYSGEILFVLDSSKSKIYKYSPIDDRLLGAFVLPLTLKNILTFGGSRNSLFTLNSTGDTIYEISTVGEVVKTIPAPESGIADLGFDVDSGTLILGKSDKVLLMNPTTGSQIASFPATSSSTLAGYESCFSCKRVYPDVLVVDDDNGPGNGGTKTDVESYYYDALDANLISYDILTIESGKDGPGLDMLSKYKMVIWFTGGDFSSTNSPGAALTRADEDNLMKFLDGGGGLLLVSQDYYFTRGFTKLMKEYLGIQSVSSDMGFDSASGAKGSLAEGMIFYKAEAEVIADFADALTLSDSSQRVFLSQTGEAIGLQRTSGTYRIVYLAFPFENLDNSTSPNTRSGLMKRIIDFL
jgi:hypothetical protein